MLLFQVNVRCTNYTVLNETDRAQGNASWPHYRCDKDLVTGWYRLQGPARDRMADKCVLKGRCGNDFSGWLNQTHPTVTEGVVTRKVCFSDKKNCCVESHLIKVKNCSSYYVYELPSIVVCKILRSCGNKSDGKLNCCLLCITHENNTLDSNQIFRLGVTFEFVFVFLLFCFVLFCCFFSETGESIATFVSM